MRWIRSFVMFWYEFVVGDDVRIALGVVVSLAAVDLLAHRGVNAWWLLPVVVPCLLFVSLRRASR